MLDDTSTSTKDGSTPTPKGNAKSTASANGNTPGKETQVGLKIDPK